MREEDANYAEITELTRENGQLKERISELSMHLHVFNNSNDTSEDPAYDTHERDATIIMGDALHRIQSGNTGGQGFYPQLENIDSNERDKGHSNMNHNGTQIDSMILETHERKSTRINDTQNESDNENKNENDVDQEILLQRLQQQQQRQLLMQHRQGRSRQSLSAIVIPSPKEKANLNQAIQTMAQNAMNAAHAAAHKIEQTPAESDVLTRITRASPQPDTTTTIINENETENEVYMLENEKESENEVENDNDIDSEQAMPYALNQKQMGALALVQKASSMYDENESFASLNNDGNLAPLLSRATSYKLNERGLGALFDGEDYWDNLAKYLNGVISANPLLHNRMCAKKQKQKVENKQR